MKISKNCGPVCNRSGGFPFTTFRQVSVYDVPADFGLRRSGRFAICRQMTTPAVLQIRLYVKNRSDGFAIRQNGKDKKAAPDSGAAVN